MRLASNAILPHKKYLIKEANLQLIVFAEHTIPILLSH